MVLALLLQAANVIQRGGSRETGGGGGEGRYNRNLNVHEARGIKTFCVVSEGVGFLSVARERAEICIPDDGAVDRVKIGENPKPGIGVARTTGRWHKRGSGCAA